MDGDLKYPIEQQLGAHGPVWVVWSVAAEYSPGRSHEGLQTFPEWEAARYECSRRNLALAIERGHADQPMPALGDGVCNFTYRQFYESHA